MTDGRDFRVEGNDTSGYIGVDPEYMTYANPTEAPLLTEAERWDFTDQYVGSAEESAILDSEAVAESNESDEDEDDDEDDKGDGNEDDKKPVVAEVVKEEAKPKADAKPAKAAKAAAAPALLKLN